MSARRMNRALVLEARNVLADGAGGVHSDWQALGSLWADVRGLSGRARDQAGVSQSLLRLKITVRAAPEGSALRPRPEQRFREGGRLYRITAVAEGDPAARYLTCYAVEEVAA